MRREANRSLRQHGWELAVALHDVLRKHWAIDRMWPLQERAARADIHHRDSLVVLPTGGGKSLCYQAPAMAREDGGVTLVVSPLIALMKDQVDQCAERGIPAAFLNSSQHAHEQERIERNAAAGTLRLLYVSPERLDSPACLTFLAGLRVAAIAVDEAHCISQWGHEFRPAYHKLGNLRALFPSASIHAYTATATERTRAEIVQRLCLRDPLILIGDFDRPNLMLRSEFRTNVTQQIIEYVIERTDQIGIVYCTRRAEAGLLADMLSAEYVPAVAYHAGLDPKTRTEIQDAFMDGAIPVVVATIAFGMGVNKPDIRYVLHASMPQSIEHFHQQIGRAGRDGEPADCLILWTQQDYYDWHEILCGEQESVDGDAKLERLMSMYGYCQTHGCRRRFLVEYFDPDAAPESCNACDNCVGSAPRTADVASAPHGGRRIANAISSATEQPTADG